MTAFFVSAKEGSDVRRFGPFPSKLHAADWASNHSAHTRAKCRVERLEMPPFYGESL